MSEFVLVCIDDLPIHIGDGNYSAKYPKASEFVETGIPFISASDFSNGRISSKDFRFISEEQHATLLKGHLKPGDVLVVTRGNGTGDVAWVDPEYDDCNINAQLVLLRTDEVVVHNRYLYFLLSSKEYKEILVSYSSGSAQPQLPIRALKLVELRLPPYEQQVKTAHILSSIDNKIELNRQTNQILEQIAQAIFKSWFVDFDPVKAKIIIKEKDGNELAQELAAEAILCGAITLEHLQTLDNTTATFEEQLYPLITTRFPNNAPENNNPNLWQPEQLAATAKLFPNAMVESELGGIPEGWEAGSIGNLSRARGGFAFKSKDFVDVGNPVVKIKNITGTGTVDIEGSQCISDQTAGNANRYKLRDGDLLMAMTGATVGKTGIVVVGNRDVYLNQRVAKFESDIFDSNVSWFLYCCFKREVVFDSIVGSAQGSAQPNIGSSGIEAAELVVPGKHCVSTFCDLVSPLFEKWISNFKENKTLEEIRNALLPKLLSGDLTLNNAG